MAKDNAQIQRDKRAKEKALLDRIGAEKRTLIVSKALDDALQVLGERHDFEEWQETLDVPDQPGSSTIRRICPLRHHVATGFRSNRKAVATA